MRIWITLFNLVTGVLLTSVVLAHHGWGGYKDWLEMEVTITALRLGNPHDRLIAADAHGNEWNLLLAPPARNRRFGFTETSVRVGDVVDLYGQKHPRRLELKVHCIYRESDVLYAYRYDNGRSSLKWTRSEKKSC